MRIAVSQSCFPGSTWDEAILRAAEAGAGGVELVFADEAAMASLTDLHRMAQLAEAAKDVGVAVPSLSVAYNRRTDGLLRSSDATAEIVAHISAALYAAVELGADVVHLPFAGKAAIEDETHLAFLGEHLIELGAEAETLGVSLGVESMLSLNQKITLSDLAGWTAVRHYFNVGHVQLRKLDPASELRKLGAERVCQVAFRDVLAQEGRPPVENLRLGEGQVDFPAVIRSLQAVGFFGWICLTAPAGEDAVQTARENLAFIRKCLAG